VGKPSEKDVEKIVNNFFAEKRVVFPDIPGKTLGFQQSFPQPFSLVKHIQNITFPRFSHRVQTQKQTLKNSFSILLRCTPRL
jgi:hypothetical protein